MSHWDTLSHQGCLMEMNVTTPRCENSPHRTGCGAGFTVIEMAVALGIVTVIAALGLLAFSNLSNSVRQKNVGLSLVSNLSLAHARALTRQRTQLVVVDAVAGTNTTYGFYHFEDAANPPNIFAANDLNTILGALNPSLPSTAPNPYVLTLIDSSWDTKSPYLSDPNSWDGGLPFPFGAVSTNTAAGCSFCANGMGAVAFLPNGRAIFNDGNVLGGVVVLQSTSSAGATGKVGVAISPTGFIQRLVPP
jgi:type II secretory pathway pseudopilin PulG